MVKPRVRYDVREVAPFGEQRVFHVRLKRKAPVEVWFSQGKAWCCVCRGTTAPMRTSCYHARAVLRRIPPDQIAPPWSKGRALDPVTIK